jgi:UDP-galactopyranose mutase
MLRAPFSERFTLFEKGCNSEKVWRYLSQFTEWHPYYHQVLALVDGKKVPVPFNLNSLYAVFTPGYASKLEELAKDSAGNPLAQQYKWLFTVT